MRHKFRLGRGARMLPALGATVALAVVPTAASAHKRSHSQLPNGGVNGAQAWWNDNLDPQQTNVPYLAWNGEEVRLESCVPLLTSYVAAEQALGVDDNGEGYVPLTGVTPSFVVEDWSGNSSISSNMAQMEPGTANVFLTDNYQDGPSIDGNDPAVCAEGNVTSDYPGMARIKLVVTANSNINQDFGELGLDSAQNVFKTQYLAGWMTLDKPSIKEMAAGDFGDSADAATSIGDPGGTGSYTGATDGSGFKDGYVDVHVTGNMPMSGDWAGAVGKSSVDLPSDWVTLAKGLASDSNPADSTPWYFWDTSGDSNDTEGHVDSYCVASEPAGLHTAPAQEQPGPDNYFQPLDNGDNCYGGSNDQSGFSSILGQSGDDATGPYDPVDGYDTWLPDGNLDSQDAPMPAARVDVAIAQNSGAQGDLSGVGALEPANKDLTYSRDFTGRPTAHNLYAPFYNEYIPATGRGDVASGIDGAVITGDFPNFFNGKNASPKYHFWDTAKIAGNDMPLQTGCLNRTSDHTLPIDASSHDFYSDPSGDYDVAVYTDQNGEAQVRYNPNTGYYLDQNASVVKNSDGGCDLGKTFGNTIGTSAITATAKYPFQPGNYKPQVSDTLTKNVISSWQKIIGWTAKGLSDGNNDYWRLVEVHAQNIDGSYDGHEIVCFSAPSDATINPFTGTDGNGISYDGRDLATGPSGDLENANRNSNRTCEYTDVAGNAIVEVLSSSPAVDVMAEFENEALVRNIDVPFGPGTPASSAPGTLPPVTVTSTPPSTGTTLDAPTTVTPVTVIPATHAVTAVAPTLASIQKLAKVISKGHKAPKIAARVRTLRLVMPTHHQHYLLIRVASHKSSAKLTLTLVVRHGGKKVTIHRTITVRTNRSVKVKVNKSVAKIKGARLVG